MQPSDLFSILREVIHDLKQPLTAAKGYIELVEIKGGLNADGQKYSEKAIAQLDRMEADVNNLLEMAWLEADLPLNPDEVRLSHVVERALEVTQYQAERAGVTLKVDFDKRGDAIDGDQRRLIRVAQNLISNAIKYNRPGGTVEISLSAHPDHVSLIVKDTGLGIPPEDMPYIFDRFYRSRRDELSRIEGNGLGLSITRGIVERHGGDISVQSELEQGSTFIVNLPRKYNVQKQSSANEALDGVDDDMQEPGSDPDLDADGVGAE